jgi:hypothetical protein
MVLFSQAVQSACGFNSATTGPFYCPPDQKLYFDTSFFEQLARMGGPGDFAQAYVIGQGIGERRTLRAHEAVGEEWTRWAGRVEKGRWEHLSESKRNRSWEAVGFLELLEWLEAGRASGEF